MPTKPGRHRLSSRSGSLARISPLVAAVLLAGLSSGACSEPGPSSPATSDGLIALIASDDGVALEGWEGPGVEPVPIELPGGDTNWIATGRADVLAATRADGSVATSDPVALGEPLDWRHVRATGPDGTEPAGPEMFATWDPEGGRYAILAGDLVGGGDIRLVLVDPTVRTAFEIDLGRSVLAAPPTWIGDDRVVVIGGDTADPSTMIVDTTSGTLSDGRGGVRLLAASADGRRIATMAGRGAPIIVRETDIWLDGDGSSLGSIDPPDRSSTAIAFALDDDGDRLAIAWAADDGSVSVAVHGGTANWHRVSIPSIGSARGAVVAWRRGS